MLLTLIQTIYHAIEDLLAEYKQMMISLAYSILKDYQLAEDTMQEVSLKLSENIDRVDNLQSDRTKNYIYTVTKNMAIAMYRKEKKFDNDVQFLEENALSNIEGDLDIKIFADDFGFGEEIREALSRLGEIDRDIICYKFGAGYNTKEIASKIGQSSEYVYKRLQRATAKLEVIIEEIRREEQGE